MKTMKQLFFWGAFVFAIPLSAQSNMLIDNQKNNEICLNADQNIPMDLPDLATKTRLNLNLNNHCTFQTIHSQIRTDQASTEIIARFHGTKSGEDFAIEKVELKHFEVTNDPRAVVIDTAYFKSTEMMKIIVVSLKEMNKSERNSTSKIDFVLIPDVPEMVNTAMIMDTHILNEEDLYPKPDILKATDEEALGGAFGRHCNMNIIY